MIAFLYVKRHQRNPRLDSPVALRIELVVQLYSRYLRSGSYPPPSCRPMEAYVSSMDVHAELRKHLLNRELTGPPMRLAIASPAQQRQQLAREGPRYHQQYNPEELTSPLSDLQLAAGLPAHAPPL